MCKRNPTISMNYTAFEHTAYLLRDSPSSLQINRNQPDPANRKEKRDNETSKRKHQPIISAGVKPKTRDTRRGFVQREDIQQRSLDARVWAGGGGNMYHICYGDVQLHRNVLTELRFSERGNVSDPRSFHPLHFLGQDANTLSAPFPHSHPY